MFENFKLIGKNIGTQGLNTLLALGFTVFAARTLNTPDYGELRYTMTMLPLFMVFTLPGYDSMVLRDTSLRGHVPLWKIFRIRFAGGLVGGGLIIVTATLFGPNLGSTLSFFLILTAILLPFFETGTGFRNYLVGRGLRHQSLNLVFQARLSSLILLALMGGGLIVLGASVVWIYPAYLLSLIAPTLVTFLAVIFRKRGRRRVLRQQRGGIILGPAIATTAASLVYTLSYSLDKLWVRFELGPEALALYSILIMAPQELAKLLDATLPLYYRKLFFNQGASSYTSVNCGFLTLLAVAVVVILVSFTTLFYFFSTSMFGIDYSYPLSLVLLSGLLMFGQSFEYFCNHKIFARNGAKGQLVYSLLNLILSAAAIPFGLFLGGVAGIIAIMLVKQILAPPLFLSLYRHR